MFVGLMVLCFYSKYVEVLSFDFETLRFYPAQLFQKKTSYLFMKLMLIAQAGECSFMNSVACLCIMGEAVFRTEYCQKICFALPAI